MNTFTESKRLEARHKTRAGFLAALADIGGLRNLFCIMKVAKHERG